MQMHLNLPIFAELNTVLIHQTFYCQSFLRYGIKLVQIEVCILYDFLTIKQHNYGHLFAPYCDCFTFYKRFRVSTLVSSDPLKRI